MKKTESFIFLSWIGLMFLLFQLPVLADLDETNSEQNTYKAFEIEEPPTYLLSSADAGIQLRTKENLIP